MTINQKLALMDEIKRKNNAAWSEHASRHKVKPIQPSLSPSVELVLMVLITFFGTMLMGIVALIA